MFTQCRGCGELFGISVDEIVAAQAMVRCSACGTVFNCLETLSDYRPQENADLMLHDHDNPPPLLTHEFKQPILKPNTNASPSTTHTTQLATPEEIDEAINDFSEPEEVINIHPDFRVTESTSSKKYFMWMILLLLALSLLVWQAVDAIKSGSFKLPDSSISKKICETIHCYEELGESNLNNIALVSRSIRQHPGRDNALIISAGIINGDDKIQQFPALQVKMSNLQGDVVAMRRFLPSEYMDLESIDRGMLINTLVPITLELQSPGQNAVTFEVSFSPTFDSK
jgi:predicted Zn finger-like uncharacterized protein